LGAAKEVREKCKCDFQFWKEIEKINKISTLNALNLISGIDIMVYRFEDYYLKELRNLKEKIQGGIKIES